MADKELITHDSSEAVPDASDILEHNRPVSLWLAILFVGVYGLKSVVSLRVEYTSENILNLKNTLLSLAALFIG